MHTSCPKPTAPCLCIPNPKFVQSKTLAGTNATTAQTVQLAKTPLGEACFVINIGASIITYVILGVPYHIIV